MFFPGAASSNATRWPHISDGFYASSSSFSVSHTCRAQGRRCRAFGHGTVMIVMGRLGGGRRRVARRDSRISRKRAVETRSIVVHDLHGPHHIVVFVVENMAVPYVTRSRRRIERECVLSREQVRFLH